LFGFGQEDKQDAAGVLPYLARQLASIKSRILHSLVRSEREYGRSLQSFDTN
jgi:hypothetical protein